MSAFEKAKISQIRATTAIEVTNPHNMYEDMIGTWSNAAKETIRLFVVPRVGGARPYAPPGMYKEVEVNGQPAILVLGRLAPAPHKIHRRRASGMRRLGCDSPGARAIQFVLLKHWDPA